MNESITLIPHDKADTLYTIAQGIQDCSLPGHKPGYLATFVDTRSIYINDVIKDSVSSIVDYNVIEQSSDYVKGSHPLIATVTLIVRLFFAEFLNCRSVMPGIHVSSAMNALMHDTLSLIHENAGVMIEKSKRTIGTKYSGPVIYMLLDLSIQLKEIVGSFESESKGEAEKLFIDAMTRLPQMTNRASNQMLIAYIDDLEKSSKIQDPSQITTIYPIFHSNINSILHTDHEALVSIATITVHEVTLSALSFLKGLTEYESLLGQYKFRLDTRKKQIIPEFITSGAISEVELFSTGLSTTGETESLQTTNASSLRDAFDSNIIIPRQKLYPSFYVFGLNMLTALEMFLQQSANFLKKQALASIFLMNNNHYIGKFLKSDKTLALYFSDDILRYDKQTTNQMQIYVAVSWIPCMEKLRKDDTDASISHIKDILKQLNQSLDEAIHVGKTCAIPNKDLRFRVIKEIKDRIVPQYEMFVNKHIKIIQENPKWIRWEPSKLSSTVQSLFTLS